MDTKIENGDMVLGSTGEAVYVSGRDEAIQRAMFCITVKRGGFVYNKSMGVSAVTSALTERDRKNLEARLKEAVMGIQGLEIFVKCAEELIDGTVKADIAFVYDDAETDAEVIFDGEL